jgi:hypothetical protein
MMAQLSLETAAPWEPMQPRDMDQRAVLHVLQDGARHTRGELARETFLPDRAVRAAVAELRRAGWPVCSSPDRAGYILSWLSDDLERLEADLRARALSALEVRGAIRRARQRRAA